MSRISIESKILKLKALAEKAMPNEDESIGFFIRFADVTVETKYKGKEAQYEIDYIGTDVGHNSIPGAAGGGEDAPGKNIVEQQG